MRDLVDRRFIPAEIQPAPIDAGETGAAKN